jgi:hypothetical protein
MKAVVYKFLLVLALIAALPACKLAVLVDEGGDVEANVSGFDCDEFNNCVFIIEDTSFNVAFTAIPKADFQFSHWQGGPRYLCPGSPNPTCALDAGVPGIENEVASDKTYSLRPVFVREQASFRSRFVILDSDPNGRKPVGEVVSVDYAGFSHLAASVLLKVSGAQFILAYRGENFLNVDSGSNNSVFFNSADCTGSAYFVNGFTLSDTFTMARMVTRADAGGVREIWAVRPDTSPRTFGAYSLLENGACVEFSAPLYNAYPAELLVSDFNALFPPPYNIRLE